MLSEHSWQSNNLQQLKCCFKHFTAYAVLLQNFSNVQTHDVSAMNVQCEVCDVWHWSKKTCSQKINHFSVCCADDDIILNSLLNSLDIIQNLYTDDTSLVRVFWVNSHQYNSSVTFTSLKYESDNHIADNDQWDENLSFSIHRELFHWQNSLWLTSEDSSTYLQLFFYDSDYAMNVKHRRNANLNKMLLQSLTIMLQKKNSYYCMFKIINKQLNLFSNNFEMQWIVITAQMCLIVKQNADCRKHNLSVIKEISLLISIEYD